MHNTGSRMVGFAAGLLMYFVVSALQVMGQNVIIQSNQTVIISNPVTASGNILIQSFSGDVILNATVTSTGGRIDVVAANDIEVMGAVTTSGGNVEFGSGLSVTVAASVDTTGGDFIASGADFDNTGGEIDTGASGTGGAIRIIFDDTVTINTSLISGGPGVEGGAITVMANNSSMAAAGGLTINENLDSSGGFGGSLSLSAGTTLSGSVNVGAGDISLDGGALDLFINTPQAFSFNTRLRAKRDVVISSFVGTAAGRSLTIEADTDGLVNTDGLGSGLGGVLVQGTGVIDAGGSVVIKGSELLAVGGAPSSVSLAGVANTVTAAGSVLIEGKASAPAGSDVYLSGAISSVGGSITITSVEDVSLNSTVITAGGVVTLDAANLVDINSPVDTGGGDFVSAGGAFDNTGGTITTRGGAVNLNHAGTTTVGAKISTSGGDFIAVGEDLDNTGGIIDTGTGALGTGGLIDIAMNDQVVIGASLVSGGLGVDGGAISVIANNSTMVASGGLTINANLDSSGGAGGTFTVGAGTTLSGSVNMGAGDILIDGGGLDMVINTAQVFYFNAGLRAKRDVVINSPITTGYGRSLTIEADTDGLVNADGLGSGLGGVLVQGTGLIDAGGSVVIKGSELLAVGGAPSSVSLAGVANTVTAAGNVLIEGKAPAPAGSDVHLSGAVRSIGGGITILSAADVVLDRSVNTAGGVVILDAANLVDINSPVDTGGGDFIASGAHFDNTGGEIDTGTGASGTGGEIRITFDDTVTIAANLVSSGPGVEGGAIKVVADNSSMAVAGGLTIIANLDSSGGAGGTFTVGAGTTLSGSVNMGAGDILIDGGGMDMFINTARVYDFNAGLRAKRDVVINSPITTVNGVKMIIEADTDGLVNTDGLGSGLGGVLVQGTGIIDSSGSVVIRGSELLAVGGAPSSVSVAGIANTVTAAGNVLIEGKAPAPAGSDIVLSGTVSSIGGNITILAAQSITLSASGDIATTGGDIVMLARNGGITMSDGATSVSGGGNMICTSHVDAVIGLLNAGAGEVGLVAGHDILDGISAGNSVTADAFVAVAGNGIGFAGNPLEVDVPELLYQADAAFVLNSRVNQFVIPLLVTGKRVQVDGTVSNMVVGIAGSGGDLDGDGIPDDWEITNGLNPGISNAPSDNADGDWMTDIEEYWADTQPTNSASYFPAIILTNSPTGTMTLVVDPTSTARIYGVHRSTNLLQNPQVWTLHELEKIGTGSAVSFTVTNHAPRSSFFRAGVRLP